MPHRNHEAKRRWRREYERRNRAAISAANRERKKRYQGVCCDCGGPTDGSNGKAKAPERCASCRREYEKTTLLYWTPERLIAAAQHWHELFGYPPSTASWRVAATVNGYRFPNASSCYADGTNHLVPWENWADFLEAAGFPGYHGKGAGNYRVRRAAKELAA